MVLALLLGGDEDEPGPRRPVATAGAQAAPEPLALDPLVYPRKGLRLERPEDWRAERRRGIVRLRSGDGRVAVAIAPRPRALGTRAALREAERAIRDGYDAVRVLGRSPSDLGGRGGRAAELVARGRRGALVDLLLIAGASPWRTYVLTAASLRPTGRDAVQELGAVLQSIELRRPAR